MIILGLDTSTVNWYLVLYVLSSICFLAYATSAVYSSGQIRGVIFAIGTFLVLLNFGLKWFGNPGPKNVQWPPVINMCPDYLTYIATLSDNNPGCVDMLGVGNSANFLVTQPSDLSTLASTTTNKVIPYTSADVLSANDVESLRAICDACQTAGLTWEGVFDGDSCLAISRFSAKQEAQESCLISV